MGYMPGSTVTLTESALHTAPAGPYQTVRAERTTTIGEGKDQLAMLVDPMARTAVAGLLFPLPPTDPPVTGETLPRFVQEVLPQALGSYLGSRVKIPWPMSPIRPSGVLPLIAKVETGYGPMQMALAISTDGKYLALGGSWPLDRDPRARAARDPGRRRRSVGPRSREGHRQAGGVLRLPVPRLQARAGPSSNPCWRRPARASATVS